jgi:tetratricopeptide (TPR) repeat protein
MIPYDTQGNLKRNNVSEALVHQYIGYTALEQKKYDLAIQSFERLIKESFNDPNIYLSMSRIYTERGDTTKALEYIGIGRKQFDDNRSLLNEEIRLYLESGKTEVLIGKFQDAINLDPYNVTYNYFMAVLYEQSGRFDDAISAYRKTLEVDPNYFDAVTGIAALYFNKGADIDKKVKQMDLKEYSKSGEKMEKEAADYFNKALVEFKKAYELNAKDISLLKSMKTLYVALRNMPEANKIDKEMKEAIAEKQAAQQKK